MWVLGSNIVTVRTGHVVSAVCSVCGCWGQYSDGTVRTGHVVSAVFRMWVLGSNIVTGLYVLDMWSVLCVPYVGAGV